MEIANTGSTAATLDGIALVLVNGGDGTEYDRVDLTGSLAAGGYLSIEVEAQNGAPDGVALIATASGSLLDALSYEGAITAATIDGQTYSLVEGTALAATVADSNATDGSLSRLPDKQDTNDAASDWAFTSTKTPGAANVAVTTDLEFVSDATVWGLFPHTHLRGKKWDYKLALPNGETRTILSVPKYDFNWQTYYMFKEPLQVPKGAKIISTAVYDNSAANKSNPDATKEVLWGDQTWQEMQYSGVLISQN